MGFCPYRTASFTALVPAVAAINATISAVGVGARYGGQGDGVREYSAPNADFCGQLPAVVPNNAPLAITAQGSPRSPLFGVDVRPSGVRKLSATHVSGEDRQVAWSEFRRTKTWQGITGMDRTAIPGCCINTLTTLLERQRDYSQAKILCRKRPRLLPMVDSKVLSVKLGADTGVTRQIFPVYRRIRQRQAAVEALRPTASPKWWCPPCPYWMFRYG